MEIRDLPAVVKATFGVGSDLSVNFLTLTTLLQEQHNMYCPISSSTSAPSQSVSRARAAARRHPRPSRDGDREHLAAVVVGVLADQVHAPRSARDDGGLAPEYPVEKRLHARSIHLGEPRAWDYDEANRGVTVTPLHLQEDPWPRACTR